MRNKTIVLATIFAGLGITATAWAYIERTDTLKPAMWAEARLGCVNRQQAFWHEYGNGPGTLVLRLEAWNSRCEQRVPTASVAGKSHIRLAKWSQDGMHFCGGEHLVDTNGWREGSFEWRFEYNYPPCGEGWYKVVSCSEALSFKPQQSGQFTQVARTVEDCSSFLTWTYSNTWHDWCGGQNCDPRPPGV